MNALARYVPRIKDKKWSTIVCDGNKNGGIHDLRQFKKLIAMLEHAAHNWRNPRLYHLILTGGDRAIYQQTVNKFCRRLRATGALCDYKAAIEHASDKGLHQHVMLVMSTDKRPSRYITPTDETGVVDASLLRRVVREVQAKCCTLACRVQPPASRKVAYIELNKTNNEFLNEAVEWASYIVKARSKLPAAAGRCYTSSRPDRRAVVPQVTTPPVCLANAVSAACISKNVPFPTSASGKKCRKTPVYGGIDAFKAGLASASPPIMGRKVLKTEGKQGIYACFQPHSKARRWQEVKEKFPALHRRQLRIGTRSRAGQEGVLSGSEVVSSDPPSKRSVCMGQKILNKVSELVHN